MYTPNISTGYTTNATYSPTVRTAETSDTSASTKSTDAKEAVKTADIQQDTYESTKTADTSTVSTEGMIYKPNASLVSQLKAEQEAIQSRFLDMVRDMIHKQGKTAASGDGIWKQFSQGDFTVSAQVQSDAQSAISDDGYWGVKQTSERLVNFAKALTGGDPARAEEMRSAFIKGYQQAAKAMGGTLPDIASRTYDATMKLFDDWASEASDT